MTKLQKWGGRRAACVLLAASVLLASTSAWAIDKNQLVQMAKLGLDDKAIIAAIDSSGDDELQLSKEELGELRLQGVSEKVIAHLKASGRVVGAAPAAEQAPAAEPAPAPAPAPAPGAAPAPGEMSLEPAPAPAEGETEEERLEREAAEKAREKEILEKAQELKAKEEQAEQLERQIAGQARKLPQAAEMVASGDNMGAARIYLEFIELKPDTTSPEWYQAKFGLAKALYQQGILSGASTPLLEVLLAGAEQPHFKEAFYMLEDLTREIGYQPPVLEELTQLYIGDKDADFQADFNYYMGKFFFDYNKSDLAIEYLQKVPESSKDYPEALYIMGVARLDPNVNDVGGALKNFQNAIIAGEREPGGNQEILELGYLALARTWYEVGLYDVALYYYQKVPESSGRQAEATFETAWTYFMKNDPKRALGMFHTLHSPYYAKWYFPDLYIMEANVYLNLCKFEQSKVAMAKFQTTYLDKQPRLQAFLQETQEPKAYWNAMLASYEGEERRDGPPRMFTNAVLDDLEFYNIYRVIDNLKKEQAALKQNVAALGEFGRSVLDRVGEQLSTKVEEGGILVQQKLSQIDRELTDWDLKATQISFDIDAQEKDQLEQRLQNPNWEPPQAQQGTTFLVVADDWQTWDFEGEYWLDEVSNYRSSLRTECVEQ